jgi:uncharacterized DUF497 family protein
MKSEFDREKSRANRQKHGVSLAGATAIWQEAYLEVAARTVDEPRLMAIGTIRGKRHACIYTLRGETIRLISCRRARPQEEALYARHFAQTRGTD